MRDGRPPEDALLRRFARLRAAVVSDVLDALGCREQAMCSEITPLGSVDHIVGRAVTLRVEAVDEVPPALYETQFEAIDALAPDDVLVVAAPVQCAAFWGELMTTRAMSRGCAGAVVDGYTRDLAAIRQYEFPVWARGAHPTDSAGRLDAVELGGEIRCGGVVVRSGDVVVGDLDGVVVVPGTLAGEVAEAGDRKTAKEREVREALRAGMSARDAFDRYGVM